MDRYSVARYGEDNFLTSFIFLLASCFSFVLDVAATPSNKCKPSIQQSNEIGLVANV